MNTTFKMYFKNIIEEVGDIIKRLNIAIDKKEANKIATDIVEVEILFTILNSINEDFANEMAKKNDKKFEFNNNLITKIGDIKSLLYLNRMPHWNFLSFKGKVLSARLQKWFLQYSTNSVLIEKVHRYFSLSQRINAASNDKVSFVPLILANKYSSAINALSKESILNLRLFNENGCTLNLEDTFFVQDTLSCPYNRMEIYKIMISQELNPEPMFSEKEVNNINKLVFNINEKGKVISNSNQYKAFTAKTSIGEFSVHEDFRELLENKYRSVIEKLKVIQSVEKRDKVEISVTLDELKEAARLLDKKLGGSRFLDVLNGMDFIDPKTKSRCTTLVFDGFCNMVGMVNTGKTTFMLIVAVTLAKKGLKTGLVLRDNDDAFYQYKALLNDTEGIHPVPVLGQSSKKEQFNKVLNQSVEENDDLESELLFKDTIYEHVSFMCPLKSCLVNNTEKDIFSDLDKKDDFLCNRLYCNGQKITCPFVYDCDSVRNNERILDGNVFLTNAYSFAQTAVNKYFIEGERRVAEFLYDSCDLVLFDESDMVQFIADSMFVNSSPVYNVKGNPSIIENIDKYFLLSQGKAMDHPILIDLLNTMSITRIHSFNILKLLSSNAVPSSLSKGPINSKSVYGFISWMLTREVDCIKSIASSTVNLNRTTVTDFSNEDFVVDDDKYKSLLDEFKKIANYIYTEYKKEYVSESALLFNNNLTFNTDKYASFSSYINLVVNQSAKSRDILKNECLEFIFNTNLCNDVVVELIKENDAVNNMVLDVLGFAFMLNKLECDIMQVMNTSHSIKATLREVTDSDVEDIPSIKPYIKDYRDVLSKCPLDMSIGLKYDRENKSLSSTIWSNVGRELVYNYSDLWRYVRADKNSGVNIAVLSGTSFMPSSPLYHIEKPVNYLIKTKKEKELDIKFVFAPEKDENGDYIFNSGINKNINGNGITIYKKFAKAFCTSFKGNATKLDYYLKEYTKPGRNRMLISVGTYEHAAMLASYIYEHIEHIDNSKVKVACLSNGSLNISNTLNLPSQNYVTRQAIKDIESTDFNIVVVPQTALQRGINMVGEDITSTISNGKKVASFSCILKTNRDYQTPNSNEYAVARIHSRLNRILKDKVDNFDNSYNLDDFIKDTLLKLNTMYDEYYISKYFAELSEDEREMLIADLCAEDFQFIGRVIRGDSDATIIMADASFFRQYTKDGSIDNEKTSTIVAVKWFMDRLKQKDSEYAFLIEELYSPFLNGIYEMLSDTFNIK